MTYRDSLRSFNSVQYITLSTECSNYMDRCQNLELLCVLYNLCDWQKQRKLIQQKLKISRCWHTEISDNSTVNTRFIYPRHMVFLVYWHQIPWQSLNSFIFYYHQLEKCDITLFVYWLNLFTNYARFTASLWFSQSTPGTSTNKADCQDITAILLIVIKHHYLYSNPN